MTVTLQTVEKSVRNIRAVRKTVVIGGFLCRSGIRLNKMHIGQSCFNGGNDLFYKLFVLAVFLIK